MNRFGFGGSSSKSHVEEAIAAYRKFENLMVGLSEKEKEQVFEASHVCDICDRRHHPFEEWGTW